MNTIEFPKPAKLWTGDEIYDDTCTKATATYTNKLLPLLRKHNVTIEKVDPEFPTQYFQCQHRSRHFQLAAQLFFCKIIHLVKSGFYDVLKSGFMLR